MAGRCVHSIANALDFERVLKTASMARTAHFALHRLDTPPSLRKPQLSTDTAQILAQAVDDLQPKALWLGLVVPKRHAKRSVTRSLLKRQIRAAVAACAALGNGLWVVRLRSPFDRKLFPSAASPALREAARSELEILMQRAVR